MTIPAVLCVDVEPDGRALPVPAPHGWTGFERLVGRLRPLREHLTEATGRAATLGWFLRMDEQVEAAHGHIAWAAQRYAEELASFDEAGDEIGLHPHSWRREGTAWVSDQSPAWVERCVDAALDAYAVTFGRPCRAYRHGDRYTSRALVDQLRARGVRCDLGLEPGAPAVTGLDPTEPSIGTVPAVPCDWTQPFRAHAEGDDDDALLMIPLTSSLDPAPAAEEARFGTLLLWSPPRTFATLLDVRLAGGDVRHLAFAVRTDVALEGGSLEWVEANLRQVARACGGDVAWVTPSEARRQLLEQAAPEAAACWPRSLTADALHAMAQRAAAQLEEEELARIVQQRHADATVIELERTRQATRTDLDAARAAAGALREELATLQGTRTWRLHQRLLPLLRLLRRR